MEAQGHSLKGERAPLRASKLPNGLAHPRTRASDQFFYLIPPRAKASASHHFPDAKFSDAIERRSMAHRQFHDDHRCGSDRSDATASRFQRLFVASRTRRRFILSTKMPSSSSPHPQRRDRQHRALHSRALPAFNVPRGGVSRGVPSAETGKRPVSFVQWLGTRM